MDKDVRALKRWLLTGNNTHSKMAYLLGFEHSTRVCNWVARNKIPPKELPKVKRIIDR